MSKFDLYQLSNGTLVVDCQSDFIRQFDRYDLGKPVGSLSEHGDAIGAALDVLIYGF